jgi:hypothetical protein
MLRFETTKRTDNRLLALMKQHYSRPNGFVGRNICYAVYWNDTYYGHIIGGSATLYLSGRNEFLNVTDLNTVINNLFYHVEKVNGRYPCRNFTTRILEQWRQHIKLDWYNKYGNTVVGYESLVELPRTGELYKKDNWTLVGITQGYTCKRVAGQSTDNYTGKRVWNTTTLKPKWVFCKQV